MHNQANNMQILINDSFSITIVQVQVLDGKEKTETYFTDTIVMSYIKNSKNLNSQGEVNYLMC